MAYLREQLQHERYDEIYVSPHMDDVAYSCAGRILQRRAEGARILVVTLFGTGSEPGAQTAGGKGVFDDYEARSKEELAVMAGLDADFLWLNYPELLFRKKSVGDVLRFLLPFLSLRPGVVHDDLYAFMVQLLEQRLVAGGRVFFPLGVGFHPDHRIVTDLGRAFHALGLVHVSFYEDIPYAVVPAFVALRLRTLAVPADVRVLEAARTLNHFVFRKLGWVKWLTLPVVWLYVVLLVFAHGVPGLRDRLAREPVPVLEVRDIADVIDRKVAIMRLYPSQTAFFFELDERLYDFLRRDGKYPEHVWNFPPFAPHNPRVTKAQRERGLRRPS